MGVEFEILESENGMFSAGMPIGDLERLAQDDFAVRGMKVVEGFFVPGHKNSPNNLAFLVLGNGTGNGNLISDTIVEVDSGGGTDFLYATKANVAPPYHGNGLLKKTIEKAMQEANQMGLPLVLRTSDQRVSKKYAKSHDIYTVIDGYAIHGFGFQKKGTRVELFPNARKVFALEIAPYVAAKPPTVEAIGQNYSNPVLPLPVIDASGGMYTRLLQEIQHIRKAA